MEHAGPLLPRRTQTTNATAAGVTALEHAAFTMALHALPRVNVFPNIAWMVFVAAMSVQARAWRARLRKKAAATMDHAGSLPPIPIRTMNAVRGNVMDPVPATPLKAMERPVRSAPNARRDSVWMAHVAHRIAAEPAKRAARRKKEPASMASAATLQRKPIPTMNAAVADAMG